MTFGKWLCPYCQKDLSNEKFYLVEHQRVEQKPKPQNWSEPIPFDRKKKKA
jgi:hypothetical protein